MWNTAPSLASCAVERQAVARGRPPSVDRSRRSVKSFRRRPRAAESGRSRSTFLIAIRTPYTRRHCALAEAQHAVQLAVVLRFTQGRRCETARSRRADGPGGIEDSSPSRAGSRCCRALAKRFPSHPGVVVDVGGACRGKVAFLGEIRPSCTRPETPSSEEEVDIGVALPFAPCA